MSNGKSTLIDKSFVFAIRMVKVFQHLSGQKKEFVLSKQLLKSGTSIGANIREAFNAESKNDFIHKLAIAQKESDETCYWLELLSATQFLSEKEFNSISKDSIELLKLIRSSILTAKQHLKKTHS